MLSRSAARLSNEMRVNVPRWFTPDNGSAQSVNVDATACPFVMNAARRRTAARRHAGDDAGHGGTFLRVVTRPQSVSRRRA